MEFASLTLVFLFSLCCAAHVTRTGTDKLGFMPRAQLKKKIICQLWVYNEIFPAVGFDGDMEWKKGGKRRG
jgi:hypothetical protein